MQLTTRPVLKTIRKRGNGVCVVLPASMMRGLGWNLEDAVRLDIVKGSLVVTKVKLPSVEEMALATESGK